MDKQIEDFFKKHTWLTSEKMWKRSLATLGHNTLGVLMIYGVLIAFALIVAFLGGFVGAFM